MHMERVVSADKTLQNMLRLCNIFRDVVIQLTLFYFFLQDNLIFFFPLLPPYMERCFYTRSATRA